jgi:hypothetical protein
MTEEQIPPEETVAVVTDRSGKELGRFAVTDPDMNSKVERLVHVDGGNIDFEHNAVEAQQLRDEATLRSGIMGSLGRFGMNGGMF